MCTPLALFDMHAVPIKIGADACCMMRFVATQACVLANHHLEVMRYSNVRAVFRQERLWCMRNMHLHSQY